MDHKGGSTLTGSANLIARALGQSKETESGLKQVLPKETPPAPMDPDEAIALFFAAELPEERDAAFDCVARLDSPDISAFLAAMMAHDEDPFLRVAAAAQLMRRNFEGARAYLAETLLNAGDDLLFEQAMDALINSVGPAMLTPLAAIWRDPDRDLGERRLAMMGMERADAAKAMQMWAEELLSTPDVTQLNLDHLGVALSAFVRHSFPNAAATVHRLIQQTQQASFADELDAEALRAILDEGMAVLNHDPSL